MRTMLFRAVAIAGFLALLTSGCAGLHATPNAALSMARSGSAPAAVVWGIADSGYSGNPAPLGPYLYAICDRKIYNAPSQPNPSCYQGAPTLFGVRKLTASDSFGPAKCSTDPGNCSSSIKLVPALGVIEQSTAVSVVEHSQQDPIETAQATVSVSSWSDRLTPESSTLPPGTNVKIQETVTITGSFNANCSQYAQIDYMAATAFGQGLTGNCANGKFVQCVGDPCRPGTKVVYVITLRVGAPQDIFSNLYLEAYAIDCPSTPVGCMTYAPQKASVNAATLTEHIKAVTSGVTLHFASGNSYK